MRGDDLLNSKALPAISETKSRVFDYLVRLTPPYSLTFILCS